MIRIHAALALGVEARCCRLLGAVVIKPDMEMKTFDHEDAFISTSPYPKPDADGEHVMHAAEGDEADG